MSKDITVREGNKLIAEFMGLRFQKKTEHPHVFPNGVWWDKINKIGSPTLEYHTSWDWLMPVARKFKDLDIDSSEYRQWVEEIDSAIIDEFDILQANSAILKAIQWYNLNH